MTSIRRPNRQNNELFRFICNLLLVCVSFHSTTLHCQMSLGLLHAVHSAASIVSLLCVNCISQLWSFAHMRSTTSIRLQHISSRRKKKMLSSKTFYFLSKFPLIKLLRFKAIETHLKQIIYTFYSSESANHFETICILGFFFVFSSPNHSVRIYGLLSCSLFATQIKSNKRKRKKRVKWQNIYTKRNSKATILKSDCCGGALFVLALVCNRRT